MHRGDGVFEHAGGQSAPPGMRRADLAAVVRGEHDRQAVGGEDREHGAGRRSHRGIGLRFPRRSAPWARCFSATSRRASRPRGAPTTAASKRATAVPCTCRSQRGARRQREAFDQFARDCGRRPRDRRHPAPAVVPRLNASNGARDMPAPWRSVVKACTPAGAGQSAPARRAITARAARRHAALASSRNARSSRCMSSGTGAVQRTGCAGDRMRELERLGMQRLALEAAQRGDRVRRSRPSAVSAARRRADRRRSGA